MGVSETYFFDTYALYEIMRGNPAYAKFSKGVNIITTRMNLMELHYGLLKDEGKASADFAYDSFWSFITDITDDHIKFANHLRLQFKKRKLSYIDCLGYAIALQKNIPFLTGDIQFKDLENVAYVK